MLLFIFHCWLFQMGLSKHCLSCLSELTVWIILFPGPTPKIMNQAKVTIYSRATCNAPEVLNGEVTMTMFCAGSLQGGVDSCQVSLISLSHTLRCSNTCTTWDMSVVLCAAGWQWRSPGRERRRSMVAGRSYELWLWMCFEEQARSLCQCTILYWLDIRKHTGTYAMGGE